MSSSSSSLHYPSSFESGSRSTEDTVPVGSGDASSGDSNPMESLRSTNAWGILYSMNYRLYSNIHLENGNSFTAGRDPNCNYCFEKSNFVRADQLSAYQNISKVHFKIYQIADSSDVGFTVYFRNMSKTNPNFVNGDKVLPGESVELQNNCVIALNFKDNEAFQFVNVKVVLNELKKLPVEFRRLYDLQRFKLGAGATGVVQRGRCKKTDRLCAIKIIEKTNSLTIIKDWMYEAKLMQRLDHKNIVSLFDVFDTDENIYIVLELMAGDLCNYIMENGAIEENIVKIKFLDVMKAVDYLHDQNIIHRDLKPENILMSQKNINSCILKITDFGLSRLATEKSMMQTICGTPAYIAPEILNATQTGYTRAVDVWSLGCILYIMLSSSPPFSVHRKDITMEEAIRTGNIIFDALLWKDISKAAQTLISSMIEVDVVKRIKLADAFKSEFFMASVQSPKKKRKIENCALRL